jgi:hypothetical protein
MHKILTALAVVALLALGTSIIASIALHSSIDKQSHQISALDRAEAADHKEITMLEGKVRATTAGQHITSARPPCAPARQPIGQPGLALASPSFLLTIRQDSLTAWNALAGMPFSSDTSAPGHCG